MTILTVGTGQGYSTIAAAVAASRDGDTVQVQAGTYVNDFATINTRIMIQGVGGMVNLVATVPPPDGKAYFTTNTDVSLDHLAFSGVQVADQNGSGVRYQGGNLTVTNCYFHDNQEGILGTPGVAGTGTITIGNSEFAHNGAGDGYSHNIYIGDVAKLVIDNSYFHDAVVGHEIKSRAESTTITNSRIQDGPNGTASYSIDLPNGGAAVIRNNVIQKGPNAGNPAIIAFGEEGNLRLNSSLTVTGNTILNDLNSGSAAAVWNAAGAGANVTGNAIYGLSAGQIIRGSASVPGNTTLATEPALVMISPWAGASTTAPATPASPVLPTSGPTDTLVLSLSEDAWQGDAQFTATVDGKSLGPAQLVTASHGQGRTQAFAFAGSFGAGPHQVGVSFLNDAWGGTPATDRNLYVDSISLDGAASPPAAAALYSNGTQTFTVTGTAATPTPVPTPVAPVTTSTLVLNLSEDAWQGDAQFIATLDGKSLGAAQSVTAIHGLGKTEAFTFAGSFGAGAHDLAISFTNDAWGGTSATDRNLYVNSVSLDGTSYASATTPLYSNSTAHFQVGVPVTH